MKPFPLIAALTLAGGCAGQAAPAKAVISSSAYSVACTGADQVVEVTGWSGPLPGTGAWSVETICTWHCASLDGAAPTRIDADFVVSSGGSIAEQIHSGVNCD